MSKLKAIITDFDGTLVNTHTANYVAYKEAFEKYGYELSADQYKECFGLRFDDLCNQLGVNNEDDRNAIRKLKKELYPSYFSYCDLNNKLMDFIKYAKAQGVLTCIASTAAKENLFNLINYHGLKTYFDIIISGDDVDNGKPNPEVYNKALALLDCEPDEALVFEDSEIGCEAADAAGIKYIQIRNFF